MNQEGEHNQKVQTEVRMEGLELLFHSGGQTLPEGIGDHV